MKRHDKKLRDLYKDLPIPSASEESKKEALFRSGRVFEQIAEKKIKNTQGSPREDRFIDKIIETIKKISGGLEMTKKYAIIGTAALAIVIGVSLQQQQKNLLVKPTTSTEKNLDENVSVVAIDDDQKADSVSQEAPHEEVGGEDITQKVAEGKKPDDSRIDTPRGRKQFEVDDSVPAAIAEVAEKEVRPMTLQSDMKTPEVSLSRAASKKFEMAASPGRMVSRDDRIGLGYEPVVGRDKFEKFSTNSIKTVSEEPLSTFSVDVDTASYAFMRRSLKNGLLPQKNAVRVEELINYFDYDYAVPQDKSEPFKPMVGIYQTPWNEHTKIMHIGLKGYDIVDQQKPKTNLVFLVDVSGSMSSPDKLPLLKNSLRMLVDTLKEKDTVALVVYAGAAGVVLEPTSVSEKGKITAALDTLHSGGSTAGGAGIRLAYNLAEANFDKTGVNRVILATDGDFNVGITNQEELKSYIEKKRESGISLSVLGFGQGNYNDALMQDLAQNGNGNAAYIDTLSEARKVLVDEASSTLFTIASDVKIQVEFNPAVVAEYRLIGYETRALKKEDFKNDKVDAGDIGSGHSVTALYEITPVGSKEKSIDDLRYQQAQKSVAPIVNNVAEYAFLKLRYKLPGESVSKLITMPVDRTLEYGTVDKAPEDMRFAAAVSAFGQIVRNDPFTKDYTYDDIISLANAAKGSDLYGYRAEFVSLVRLAQTARGL